MAVSALPKIKERHKIDQRFIEYDCRSTKGLNETLIDELKPIITAESEIRLLLTYTLY